MGHSIVKGSAKYLRSMPNSKEVNIAFDLMGPLVGVCFAGRSNVGKSSLINAIFGKNTARTSNTPGRTRAINLFSFEIKSKGNDNLTAYLFDLPGHGHAAVSKSDKKAWQEAMDTFFQTLGKESLVVNLQDARHPGQKVDKLFNDYIKAKENEIWMVFNKIDKLKTQKERAKLKNSLPQLSVENSHATQVHLVSAEKGTGLDPLVSALANRLGS